MERRRLSPEARRGELLAFGQRFFAEHAADALTMDEIAERAGVSKGLLYAYFGGRRGFYVATVKAIAAEVAERTRPEANMPFAAAFERALQRYLAWVREHGAVYRVLVQGGLGVDAEVSAIVETLRRDTVTRILARAGLRPTDALELAVYGWVCFAEHACLEWLRRPALSEDAMVQVLTGALYGAVGASGAALGASGAKLGRKGRDAK
jgi:AcrR family transcriptional regulator